RESLIERNARTERFHDFCLSIRSPVFCPVYLLTIQLSQRLKSQRFERARRDPCRGCTRSCSGNRSESRQRPSSTS
ncbi:hypothetical protein PMAYCL1PPCAC_08445, partial [Pristionchus mayeri]